MRKIIETAFKNKTGGVTVVVGDEWLSEELVDVTDALVRTKYPDMNCLMPLSIYKRHTADDIHCSVFE